MSQPSIPKGTRDFGPEEMARRNYIFDTIRSVFEVFGFQPIETPAMETLSTLLGKYGDEGDKLLFRILNSGDFLSGVAPDDLKPDNAAGLSLKVCEKGLRYDLTVPFARFVVQHRERLVFPFRRYQIQPVWRADRPQKGRYREFYQCDADIVGSDSLLNEAELVQIVDRVFAKLGLRVEIKVNNRKILAGLADYIGHPDKIADITVAIDKMDKIGIDKVRDELRAKGLDEAAIGKLDPVLHLQGAVAEKTASLRALLAGSETGLRGLQEIETLFGLLDGAGLTAAVTLDLTLARGLNYYTGAIFEVKSLEAPMGSISGGGRYDNLTGVFGLDGVSGVGISFGADRIYDVLAGLDRFPPQATAGTQVLFLNFGEREERYVRPLLSALRDRGVRAELYPDRAKFRKQMEYADKRRIPFVAIAGETEIAAGSVSLKTMATGEQRTIPADQLAAAFSPTS